jgi:hypothetical protein
LASHPSARTAGQYILKLAGKLGGAEHRNHLQILLQKNNETVEFPRVCQTYVSTAAKLDFTYAPEAKVGSTIHWRL